MDLSLVGGYQAIAMIILLICLGFFLKKKGIVTDGLQTDITALLIKVVIPFSVFSSFITPFEFERLEISLKLLAIAVVFYVVMQLAICRILYWKIQDDGLKRLYTFGSTYSNAVFMGLPFVQALLGDDGLFFASVFNLPLNVLLWSIGFAMITKQPMTIEGIKNTLSNPVIIACVSGYIWWLVQPIVPAGADLVLTPIWNTFSSVGAAATPLSMMVIGSMVASAKLGNALREKSVWYMAFNRTITIPGLVLAILFMLGFREWTLAIPVIIVAMPVPAIAAILSNKYDVRPDIAGTLVTFTTVLTTITAPIWLIVLINVLA